MIFVLFLSAQLWAQQVYIKLGEAQVEKSPLAITLPKFLGSTSKNPNHASLANEIREIISNDLSVVGYFNVQSSSSFIEPVAQSGLRPAPKDSGGFLWESWKSIGTEFLIKVGFDIEDSKIVLESYVYQVSKGDLILSNRYSGPLSDLRKVVHTFADDIVFKVSGKRSFLLKQILVTAIAPGSQNRELYVMDWDGENKKQMTRHQTVTLSPAWSKDGKKIAYTAFMQRRSTKTRNPDLYVYDLESQKSKVISYRKGMNSGASFESSGNLLMTISGDENPDIYRVDANGNILNKLTNGPVGAMNVEPSISPNGDKIAFSSDRAGRPMIYIMDSDGSNPKRLTFAGSFNAAPSWSPDGKLIAFAGWAEKAFDIFTIDSNGSNLKRITKASRSNGRQASHENPDFSPDGRVILYTSNRNGNTQLYLSLADGSEEWRITKDNWSYNQPKWSP
jgi:TolB protein